jgi:hypothetical protein
MIAIALIAIAIAGTLWGLKMRRLSKAYAATAQTHKRFEAVCRQFEADSRQIAESHDELRRLRSDDETPFFKEMYEREKHLSTRMWESVAHSANNADHHAAMKRKYERAARYPWLTVDGDPPLSK